MHLVAAVLVSFASLCPFDGVDAFVPVALRHGNPVTVAPQQSTFVLASQSLISLRAKDDESTDDSDEEDEIVPIDEPTEVKTEVVTEEPSDEEDSSDGEEPSDAKEPSDVKEPEPAVEIKALSEEEITENLLFLQSVAAITSRGECATEDQKEAMQTVVADLEASNPTEEPTIATDMIEGTWELVLADNGLLFRSSPFFMAGRAVCSTPEQAEQYDWFCQMHRKALAISNIVAVVETTLN